MKFPFSYFNNTNLKSKLRFSRRGLLSLMLGLLLVAIIFMAILLVVRSCGGSGSERATIKVDSTLPSLEVAEQLEKVMISGADSYIYGLPTMDYEVVQNEIENGETFSRLLNGKFNVNISVVNRLIDLAKGKLDMRDIRAGNGYTAFLSTDSTASLQYLVYEKSLTEYVIFSAADSLYVKKEKKNVTTKECYAEGVINSSLYGTMYENKLNPAIADKLAEIYKYTIEFFTLQKGDSFKVIYQEHFIDTLSVGIGKIYGAEFIHNGKSYWAIRFQQGDEIGYWDELGKNLRKNFLRAPLEFKARVSSRFGMRVHPITRIRRPHNGVDYAAPTGTPVFAVADGVVTRKYFERGGGNTLKVRHGQGLESGYLHLSRFAKGIAQGAKVRQGQVIGYVGSTGMSTGPHLDFRIWRSGKPIDPLKIPSMPTNPIEGKYKGPFGEMKNDIFQAVKEYSKEKGA